MIKFSLTNPPSFSINEIRLTDNQDDGVTSLPFPRCQQKSSVNNCPAEFIVDPLPEFQVIEDRKSLGFTDVSIPSQLRPQRVSLKNLRIGTITFSSSIVPFIHSNCRRIVQHLGTVHSGQKLSAGSVPSDGSVKFHDRRQAER
jgi:hypothetical protein